MKSLIVNRSVVLTGHKTSVSLEDEFWKALKEIATLRDMTLSDLLATIEAQHPHGNLSSGIRLFVLNFYREELAIRDRRKAAQEMISRSITTTNPNKAAGRARGAKRAGWTK